MPGITLSTLRKLRQEGEKIVMLTSYDAIFARAASLAGVEVLLVGDSLGMVLQGHDSTVPVSMDDMLYHTQAVKRGNQGAFILADMPFLSNTSIEQTALNAGRLMQAGAHMVKLEGAAWLAPHISHLANLGIPCCAHLGLTPQSVNLFGGYKVQGRETAQADALCEAAQALEAAGAAMLLLECVPSPLAQRVTQAAGIPVIGIGAGAATDGQVLVMHDILGMDQGVRPPRFVKNFLSGQESVEKAISAYVTAVKSRAFPATEHEFSA